MPAYKNKNTGQWYVMTQYTDWHGDRKQKCKRGFETRKEALDWEHTFHLQNGANLDMTFEAFFELYEKTMRPRLKENTWHSKEHIVRTKIMPFFGHRKMNEISKNDVVTWQSRLLASRDENGNAYSPCYLKTVHNQLSAILNFAVRYFDLRSNPAALVGNMGKERRKEMQIWTQEEYRKFSEAAMDDPTMFYAFEVFYWTGIREGELLALTPADFDFEKKTLRINKSYQRLNGEDVITTPKTDKSNRIITLPSFLCDEMKDYFSQIYGLKKKQRIFHFTKHSLLRAMIRYSKEAGVKRIRIHDLRHSHVSLLIDMGYSAVAIADRMGHESIAITYGYAHLFPSKQIDMAEKLDSERSEWDVSEKS